MFKNKNSNKNHLAHAQQWNGADRVPGADQIATIISARDVTENTWSIQYSA